MATRTKETTCENVETKAVGSPATDVSQAGDDASKLSLINDVFCVHYVLTPRSSRSSAKMAAHWVFLDQLERVARGRLPEREVATERREDMLRAIEVAANEFCEPLGLRTHAVTSGHTETVALLPVVLTSVDELTAFDEFDPWARLDIVPYTQAVLATELRMVLEDADGVNREVEIVARCENRPFLYLPKATMGASVYLPTNAVHFVARSTRHLSKAPDAPAEEKIVRTREGLSQYLSEVRGFWDGRASEGACRRTRGSASYARRVGC